VVTDGQPEVAVAFEKVSLAFDDLVVMKDLSFTVPRGSMRVLLGASGSGKSLILKLTLGLLRPDAGTILVNGNRVTDMSELELLKMRADVGMVFQENALFDSLTVAENVGYRLYEETDMALEAVRARVEEAAPWPRSPS
jgi:phospholipid/cholesterol/gamma-HCH transport system ATP-binding protein